MSITGSHSTGRIHDAKIFYPLTMLSLNDMFKESIHKVQASFDFTHLFAELLKTIIDHPGFDSRLNLFTMGIFARCRCIISHNADFLVNHNNHTDCVFSFSLPGKI